jgi:hypothetical protein
VWSNQHSKKALLDPVSSMFPSKLRKNTKKKKEKTKNHWDFTLIFILTDLVPIFHNIRIEIDLTFGPN